jgi:hypothetical protein
MAHEVFLSHSSVDNEFAMKICQALETEGIPCWVAPRDVTPGRKYAACIVDAIKQARIMIIVFSSASNKSDPVSSELECALIHGLDILPVRKDSAVPTDEMEYYLSSRHWVDLYNNDFEQVVSSLARTIRATRTDSSIEKPNSSHQATSKVSETAVTKVIKQNAPSDAAGKMNVLEENDEPFNDFNEIYMDIDKQYADLLRKALDMPELRNRARTSTYFLLPPTDAFREKYHVYAYLCWNLVETIHDAQLDKSGHFISSETWEPVILEEFRLHLEWFRRNVHLFKDRFRRFVLDSLNSIEVLWGNKSNLEQIYSTYSKAFPVEERKTLDQLSDLLDNRRYRLLIGYQKAIQRMVGFAFVYEDPSLGFLWLDYLVIEERYRNSGWGTQIVRDLLKKMKKDNKVIFMELEYARSSDCFEREQQERRIQFYSRLGAISVDRNYLYPSNNGPFPMQLFIIKLSEQLDLNDECIDKAIQSLFHAIHSDVPGFDQILGENLKCSHVN